MQRAQGYVEQGSATVVVNGVTYDLAVQKCFPAATVTVYDTGTLNLATIYEDDALTPKANPFTAGSDAYWHFYAANGHYDVAFSGGDITAPYTLADITLIDSGVAGSVSSVFGRTGAVVATANDYDFTEISGTVAAGQLPAAGGDISGTLVNAAVVGLQGRDVSAAAPANGEVLVWVDSSSQWQPGDWVGGDHALLTNLDASVAGHTGYATLDGSEVLTNKTLTTPTIGSFVNATHSHESAAQGGQIDSDALSAAVTAVKGGTGQTSYAKGNLLVASDSTTLSKLAVGSNNQVLTADSAASTGIKWADPWGTSALTETATISVDSTAAQSYCDKTMTVTGAAVGNPVALGVPTAVVLDSSCYTAWVSATNTVTVRFNNYSTSTMCPGAGDFSVVVFQ